MKKWRTLLTVKLTNDAIMQLSYCPPLFPISPVLSYPSLDRQVSPRFPPILPCIVYVVHVPSYHMYISLFYYSSFWSPVPERPMSANPGLKFYSAIAFYLQYLSWCCIVLAGSQSNSTTIPDILCSHYVFIDKRPRLKICLILELNLTILRGTVPFYICPLLPWIKSLYSHIPPYPSTYTLYSLVSSLYSHISLCPSTSTLYSLVSTLYSHISPYPSTYTLYSLVSSLYSHISPYPSTSTLFSLVSSLYYHISPYPSTYTLYSLESSLFSHISPCPPTSTLYSPVTSLYSHISPYPLHIPSTPLNRLRTPIYPRTPPHLPSTPLYRLCTPIYPRTLLHIPSTPFYRLCTSDISPYPSTYTLFYPIVFVLPHIPVPLYIHPLLPCIVFVLPYIPVPFYISPLPPCIVFVLPYIPIPFYTYPLLPFIVFVLPHIPVPLCIYPLLPCIVFVLPYIPVPSTYPLYSLVLSSTLVYSCGILRIFSFFLLSLF